MVENLSVEILPTYLPNLYQGKTPLKTKQSPRKTYKQHVKSVAKMRYRNKILLENTKI
jgi:hypothetical protein